MKSVFHVFLVFSQRYVTGKIIMGHFILCNIWALSQLSNFLEGFVLHIIFYHNCFNYVCVEKDINYVKLEQKRIVPARESLHTVSSCHFLSGLSEFLTLRFITQTLEIMHGKNHQGMSNLSFSTFCIFRPVFRIRY